ncbi:phosphonate metabolism protein/1,5-bisphosphokinase (PRPP-forming) PhnN [Roseovarius gahaiensis]|uniref:Ribose 1,5-bisphosphate phosphokinase PhnN n=1 Tax=Roseovarius gahaiensis TaxID=2716691 RepID=A0A967BE91_9RHOB|nr:phosphonate metabolism protein/1,5-bisphosphokinase (PRPP-forming) PhnN [Roseovarius gahaiensis]NHQ74669.1 phosphonate metabolism protein/1,5-bisphosphokinase (PRPP-forming) PhnN [Roseovarius gahaiensis]
MTAPRDDTQAARPGTGRLIAVVGPSGVGKDSVMQALAHAAPGVQPVRRAITRPPGQSGEDYEALSLDQFQARAANGGFCLHWQAHGLHYGIPAAVLDDVQHGAQRMANLSRGVLTQAAQLFPGFVVLNITAAPATLAQRLQARGRETPTDIESRLARASAQLDPSLPVHHIENDGPLAATVASALQSLGLAQHDAPTEGQT